MSDAGPPAAFKDLCMDASDAGRLGQFWAAVLGLELHLHDDGDACLRGPTPQRTVWVDTVPEPKSVKHRIHLDVHGSSVDDLVALGATVLDDQSFRWTVLADPECGEFCLFLREQPPEQRLYEIGVDAADPAAVATWWAETLGGRLVHDERGFSWVGDIPGAPFDSLDFAPVPEPKSGKNRIHLDVLTDDVDRLLASGATLLRPRDDEIQWSVLADPEGNEFCAFLR